MKGFICGILLISISCLCQADTSPIYLGPSVPVLSWASNELLSGKNAYISKALDSDKVVTMLNTMASKNLKEDEMNILNHKEEGSKQVEALVVFLMDSLHTNELIDLKTSKKESYLKTAFQTSSSSVAVPHTHRNTTLLPLLKKKEAEIVAQKNIDSFLKDNGNKFKDGKTDLIVIELESTSLLNIDQIIKKTATEALKLSGDLCAFTLTGNKAYKWSKSAKIVARRLQDAGAATNTTPSVVAVSPAAIAGEGIVFSHYVLITPTILAGIVISLLLLWFTIIGVQWLGAIQTPTRYASSPPPHGKEY